MNAKDLGTIAIQEIASRVSAHGPPEPSVLLERSRTQWVAPLLREMHSCQLHVLGRSSDLILFFDEAGQFIGWRDDGRQGAFLPSTIDRQAVRKAVIAELDLPPRTRLGRAECVELPPVGWTIQAVLFLAAVPSPREILRVWISPNDYKVIQCLYGPAPPRQEQP